MEDIKYEKILEEYIKSQRRELEALELLIENYNKLPWFIRIFYKIEI